MKGLHRYLPLILPCLTGCFSFSYASRAPTLADELVELRKIRDRGTISAREFEMGKVALLNHYGQQQRETAPQAGPQLARLPSVSP